MSYYSAMCSRYHKTFCSLGYPQLDVVEYDDGSWAIIQYLNTPLIPSMTRWQHVLQDIRHQEKTESFFKHWAERLDPTLKQYRELEWEKSKKVIKEREDQDRFKQDLVDRGTKAVTKNEGLMERIAKNGVQEMSLKRILKHIPRSYKF